MKKRLKMMAKLLIIVSATAYITTGCDVQKSIPIVTINDKKLYLEDFLYDIYEVETEGNQQEIYNQENLGYSYWDYEYNGTTMREVAKNSILARVVMYEILADQADKIGMRLNKVQLADDDTAMDNIYRATLEEDLNGIGLSKEILKKSINKVTLGDKYRIELLKGYKVDEDIIRKSINAADYREYRTECLFIPTVKSKDNKIVSLSQEETDSANTIVTEAYAKLSTGEGFECLLNDYSKLNYITREFIVSDSLYEKEYIDAAVNLKNNEYSSVITTDYGYYIIHMLDNNSTDKYEKAIENKIAAEEDIKFTSVYNKLKAQYDITINFEYWDTITIGSITTPKN